jgi:hypothetical protein
VPGVPKDADPQGKCPQPEVAISRTVTSQLIQLAAPGLAEVRENPTRKMFLKPSPLSWRRPFSDWLARKQIGRRAVAERLVRALVVVEMEVAVQRLKQVGAIDEVAGVDQLLFQAAPQALDKNVVQGATSAVHTDSDAAVLYGH